MRTLALLCLFGALWLVSASGAQAASPEACDPRIDDFWHSIGCTDAWDERIRRRMAYLSHLKERNRRLVAEGASLRREIESQREIVAALERENADIRRDIERLQRIQVTQENAQQVLFDLQQQMALLIASLDVALSAKIGCDTSAYNEAKKKLSLLKEAYSDVSWWATVGSTAIEIYRMVKRNAPGWLRIVSFALDALSFITEARADTLKNEEPSKNLIRCEMS
jgi:hypothetical protein